MSTFLQWRIHLRLHVWLHKTKVLRSLFLTLAGFGKKLIDNIIPYPTGVCQLEIQGQTALKRRNCPIRFRPAVAEELPDVADFADHVEVHVGDHDVVLGALT